MIMNNKIPVLEIFGPTLQGEGSMIGVKTVFIRTLGCDYSCSWCDSAFTWDGSVKPDMLTVKEIIDQLDREIGFDNFQHVTISGGNPALLELGDLIEALQKRAVKVGLETQGSKWKEWFYKINDLTISPKPPSSGMETDYLKLAKIINNLEGHSGVSLKVVIFDDKDLEYAKYIHKNFNHIPMYFQVGNSDVETSLDVKLVDDLLEKLEWLVDKVMKDPELNKVRVLPQLHTLLWGNRRGV